MGEMYMSVVTVLETIIKEKHISMFYLKTKKE